MHLNVCEYICVCIHSPHVGAIIISVLSNYTYMLTKKYINKYIGSSYSINILILSQTVSTYSIEDQEILT